MPRTFLFLALAVSPACERDLVDLYDPPAGSEVVPPVSGLQVVDTGEGNTLSLTWTNPASPLYNHTRVQRDSAVVFEGAATRFGDVGLVDGVAYHYSVFAVSPRGDASAPETGSGTPTDQTPPADLSVFAAENEGHGDAVRLSWSGLQAATADEPVGLRIVRATGAPPVAPDDGELVAEVTGDSATQLVDDGLTESTPYYYRAFVFDEVPNFSAGLAASATPVDTLGPAPVVVSATVTEGGSPHLAWTLPTDPDFNHQQLVRKEDSAPVDPTDGTTLLEDAASTAFDDAGASSGVRYHYTLFTFDDQSNGTAQSVAITRLRGVSDPLLEARETTPATDPDPAISVTWANPGDADLAGVLVLRRTDSFPTDPGDTTAVQVFDGLGTGAADNVLASEGENHYYTLWTHDAAGNSGPPVQAGPELAPPSVRITWFSASGFAYTGFDSTARLSWTTSSATSCTIEPGAIAATPIADGFVDVTIPQAPTTFTLTCDGWRGPATASWDVDWADTQLAWAIQDGGDGVDEGSAVALEGANAVFYTGVLDDADVRLGKRDLAGSGGWNATWSTGMALDEHLAVIPGSPAAIYVAGCARLPVSIGGMSFENPAGIAWQVYLARLQDGAAAPSIDWAIRLGGDVSQYIGSVAVDADGSALVVGSFVTDLWLCDQANPDCCDPDDAGCAETAAGRLTTTAGDLDGFVASYSSTGSLQWTEQLSSAGDDSLAGVATFSDGAFAVVGSFAGDASFAGDVITASNARAELVVARLASDRSVQWVETASSPFDVVAVAVEAIADGGIAVAGEFKSSATVGSTTVEGPLGAQSSFVARFDAGGALQWVTAFRDPRTSTPANARVSDLVARSDGVLLVTGFFEGQLEIDSGDAATLPLWRSGTSGSDIFVAELAADGTGVWARREGGSNSWDRGRGISATPAGDALVIGSFQGTATFGSIDPVPLQQILSTPTTASDVVLFRLDRN